MIQDQSNLIDHLKSKASIANSRAKEAKSLAEEQKIEINELQDEINKEKKSLRNSSESPLRALQLELNDEDIFSEKDFKKHLFKLNPL